MYRYKSSPRTRGTALLLSCLALPLAGCGTLYLHNAEDAKAMLAGAEGLSKTRKAQTEFFQAQLTAMDDAFKADRTALIELELTRRDLDVVAILDERAKGEAVAATKAWEKIVSRLTDIEPSIPEDLKQEPKPNAKKPRPKIHEALAAIAEDEAEALRSQHSLVTLQHTYQQQGGAGLWRCLDDGSMAPPDRNPEEIKDELVVFNLICTELRTTEGRLRARRDDAQPAWFAVALGSSKRTSDLGDGILRRSAVEAANLRELLAAKRKLRAKADEHYRELDNYLQCLHQQAAAPTLNDRIVSASDQLAGFIEWLAKIDEVDEPPPVEPAQKPAAVDKKCTSKQTGETHRPAAVRSLKQLAGDDASFLTRIQQLLSSVSQFAPTRSFVSSLQAQAQEIRESELHAILSALGGSASGTDSKHRNAQIAAQAVKLISLIADLRDGRKPSTSAVLIDIADAQLKANNARIEAERLAELSKLADQRLAAVRSELTTLYSAIDAIETHGAPSLPTFLRAYNESWVRGRLQQSLLEADMQNQEYVAWTHRQRVAADAIYAMLEPAFTELKIHADGGFTPKDIATYLQTLGVGAIAVGTN